jgi:hypothetical protein
MELRSETLSKYKEACAENQNSLICVMSSNLTSLLWTSISLDFESSKQ